MSGGGGRRALVATVAVVAIAVLAVALGQLLPWPQGDGATREFTITARQFGYAPERIRVDRGDRVLIQLVPEDVAHGLYLDGYDIETHALPGGAAILEFVADRAGQFRFRCSVTCGSLHPFMIGQLNVESGLPYTNAPFLAAAAGVLIVALGSVAYGRRSDERTL